MDHMEVLILLLLIGVAICNSVLWIMLREQRRHGHAVEITLAIIKEKMLGRLETRNPSMPGEDTDAQD